MPSERAGCRRGLLGCRFHQAGCGAGSVSFKGSIRTVKWWV